MRRQKILLVDDHKIVRDGIKLLLSEKQDFEVLDCSSGKEALHLIAANDLDLVISDVNMPKMSGLELCKEIKEHWPNLKILVLTMNHDGGLIQDMLDIGVNGYLVKDSGKDEILAAISTILENDFYFDQKVAMSLTLHNKSRRNQNTSSLTERELEVLRLIAEEYTNKEIAEQLFISARTVDAHRRNLIDKIGAKNTAGLVRYALENKIISD